MRDSRVVQRHRVGECKYRDKHDHQHILYRAAIFLIILGQSFPHRCRDHAMLTIYVAHFSQTKSTLLCMCVRNLSSLNIKTKYQSSQNFIIVAIFSKFKFKIINKRRN